MKTTGLNWLVGLAVGGLFTIFIAKPSPSAEPAETSAFSVTIQTTDARTKKALTSIRVVPAPCRQRAPQITWQSQYLKEYESLPAIFSMKRAWEKTRLRIEAGGYRPFISQPLERKTGIVLDVALEPDEGIVGRVLTPDGKPAAGAKLAVCTWTNEVTVHGGTLKYGHHAERLRGLVHTDADGSFQLPGEVDDWVLVVAHESGYAERTAAEFAKQSIVTLKRWGRLEGELVSIGTPWNSQPVQIGGGRGDVNVILHYAAGETRANAAGEFVADRLPPVKMYVQPLVQHGEKSFNMLWFSGLVEIKAGEVTRMTLPRKGQDVTGQLALPEDSGLSLEDLEIELSISLRPPRISRFGGGGNESHAA